MRAKLLGAVLAALVIPTAMAADVSKAGKIAAPVQAQAEPNVWNRTGAYAGLIAGYDITVLEVEGLDFANGKLMAGGFVGFNWKAGSNFILGLEGDWIFTGISASSGSEEVFLKASTDHLISLRARAGLTLGPAMIYATAGPAWQHAKLTIGDTSERTWQLGAAFGGGVEIELSRSLFVRGEVLHYIFPSSGAPLSDFLDSENQHTTARVGLGFKLN